MGASSFWRGEFSRAREHVEETIGRYDPQGRPIAMPGHSAPFLALGVMILWFGWYGFNTGSLLGIVGQETMVPHVAIVTTLGAAGGTLGCVSYSLIMEKHWNVLTLRFMVF